MSRTVGLADRDELVLGLLATPGWPTEVAEALAEELPGLLADRVTDAVSWRVPVRTDPAVGDMSRGVEAIDLARARLLRDGWDMAVCVTDAPLRIGTRPVVADASATHGVALISLPALVAVQIRRRARDAVVRLVDGLVGESLELGERGRRRRARVSDGSRLWRHRSARSNRRTTTSIFASSLRWCAGTCGSWPAWSAPAGRGA